MRLQPASISYPFAASAVLLSLAVVLPWLPAAEDGSAPQLVATMKGHTEEVYSVAFSPDGKHVVSGSGDHTIKVWEKRHRQGNQKFGRAGRPCEWVGNECVSQSGRENDRIGRHRQYGKTVGLPQLRTAALHSQERRSERAGG